MDMNNNSQIFNEEYTKGVKRYRKEQKKILEDKIQIKDKKKMYQDQE